MIRVSNSRLPGIYDKDGRFAISFIKQIMAMPGVRVDRELFLRSQLRSHCRRKQVDMAVAAAPAIAGIRRRKIDKIANGVIRYHVRLAGAGSFIAGIPGGLALLATLPADTVQFYCHALILAQKLAYLYGWPDLLKHGEVDDDTELKVLMLIGVMLGVGQASNALKVIAEGLAHEVITRVPRQALTKTAYYPVIKKALKWIGIKVTKQSFAKGVSKFVPLVGGVIAAGITVYSLPPMADKLKKHLRKLEPAKRPRDKSLMLDKT